MPFNKPPELFDEEGDSMAFGIGLGEGFRRLDPRPGKHKSAENNPYYYYPGFVVGYFLKLVALVVGAHYAGI